MTSTNEKRFFAAVCFLGVVVLGWELYRRGGPQKLIYYAVIPGLIVVLFAWLFPYWPPHDE
ncbi:MAG: hypothetical protein ACRD24_14835 [Terriglobales bacterium]